MRIETARQIKADLWAAAAEGLSTRAERPALPVFVGVSVLGNARYGVAVRYQGEAGVAVAQRAVAMAGDDVDAREVGEVRTLSAASAPSPGGRGWLPEELQRRVRPLHPGLSIAHRDVTAGTLGAFVSLADADGVFALSNNHVLGDSDRGDVGDAVLQPGPADRGGDDDLVGHLAKAVRLHQGEPNFVDAALALLDDESAIDPTYPGGALSGWAELDLDVLDSDLTVEKVGRTTGLTRGRVTAVELDDVTVSFPVGPITFDGQIEVSGLGGAFSAGGDSGSLVYRPDTMEAVGLLFAGSERGGPDGTGLTYCNPIGLVMDALGATLVR